MPLTCSNVVPVQTISRHRPLAEVVLNSKADGSLAGTGQTREPHAAATETTLVTNHLPPLAPGHMTSLVEDIGGFHYILQELGERTE